MEIVGIMLRSYYYKQFYKHIYICWNIISIIRISTGYTCGFKTFAMSITGDLSIVMVVLFEHVSQWVCDITLSPPLQIKIAV